MGRSPAGPAAHVDKFVLGVAQGSFYEARLSLIMIKLRVLVHEVAALSWRC
jgi:hypothetical protein